MAVAQLWGTFHGPWEEEEERSKQGVQSWASSIQEEQPEPNKSKDRVDSTSASLAREGSRGGKFFTGVRVSWVHDLWTVPAKTEAMHVSRVGWGALWLLGSLSLHPPSTVHLNP